jgi:hypothetical protein
MENEKLNQPIFGCNNLAGRCWPAREGGGPRGGLAPHDFKVRPQGCPACCMLPPCLLPPSAGP